MLNVFYEEIHQKRYKIIDMHKHVDVLALHKVMIEFFNKSKVKQLTDSPFLQKLKMTKFGFCPIEYDDMADSAIEVHNLLMHMEDFDGIKTGEPVSFLGSTVLYIQKLNIHM